MKRILISITLLFATLSVSFAESVDASRAALTAAKFLRSDNVSLAWDGGTVKSALSEPSFYVFNNPSGGWVVIAGDDTVMPVLAYSDDGVFRSEGMPAQLSGWFRRIDRNVRELRHSPMAAAEKVRARWETPRVEMKASGSTLLETAAWGQGSPYNNSVCSHVGVRNLMTGCVATATAIVMRYHNWPPAPKGTLEKYTTDTDKYKVNALTLDGCYYDWDKMPLTSGARTSWTSAQKTAVADLMLHCGLMVKMDYGKDASSAYSNDILPALVKNMSYDPSCVERFRETFTNPEWMDMLRAEIESGYPIIYGGADFGGAGGHQFVIDGVNSDNFVHVNWGWDGSDNGWFACNYIGSKSVGYVFSVQDSGIFGMRPLKSDTPGEGCPNLFFYSADSFQGISLVSGTIGKGSSFRINLGYVVLESNEYDYNGPIRICLVDRNNNVRETVAQRNAVIEKADPGMYSGIEISNIECKMTLEPVLGDYIGAYYQVPSGEWVRIGREPYEGKACVDRYGVVDVPVIIVPDKIVSGRVLYPSAITGGRLVKKVSWSCDGSSVDEKLFTPSRGTHTLKAVITYKDGSRDVIVKKINVE